MCRFGLVEGVSNKSYGQEPVDETHLEIEYASEISQVTSKDALGREKQGGDVGTPDGEEALIE